MKRSMIVGLAFVAILGLVTVIALSSKATTANALDAAEPVETELNEDMNTEAAVPQEQPAVPTGQNFVDEDGDGVCDVCGNVPGSGMGNQYGNGTMGGKFVDEDGDGVCDICGNVPGSGMGNRYRNGAGGGNFVDEDGDGVCDTCGNMPGSGMGSNFVDEDGDGVCDICGMAPADGTGNQYGRQGGQGGQGRGGRWNN